MTTAISTSAAATSAAATDAPAISALDELDLISNLSAQHEAGVALAADFMSRRLPGITEYEWAHRAQDYIHNIIWENFSRKNIVHILQFCILKLREYTD